MLDGSSRWVFLNPFYKISVVFGDFRHQRFVCVFRDFIYVYHVSCIIIITCTPPKGHFVLKIHGFNRSFSRSPQMISSSVPISRGQMVFFSENHDQQKSQLKWHSNPPKKKHQVNLSPHRAHPQNCLDITPDWLGSNFGENFHFEKISDTWGPSFGILANHRN